MELSSDPTTRQAQLTAIKSHVDTNYAAAYDQNTVNSLNQTASPDFWVWKEVSTLVETGKAVMLDDLGNLTTANSTRIQAAFQLRPNGFSPSVQTDRALFGDVFSIAAAVDTRNALIAEWQRLATEAEQVLASGTGTQASGLETDGAVTAGSPATLGDGAVGEITLANIIEAENDG